MNSSCSKCDVLILGGGIVGLTIAYQLLERKITKNIIIFEREEALGKHTSGRNSGVLHAGLYYKPNSIKAKVCVQGSRRLKSWMMQRKLKINKCGKLVLPTNQNLDTQLDELFYRGKSNGAEVHFINQKEISNLIPEAVSVSGRAIWSPHTSVVNPIEVIEVLQKELIEKGVDFLFNTKGYEIKHKSKSIIFNNGNKIAFGHIINATGLQADKVAHNFGIGKQYHLLPFKGYYWRLKRNSCLKINTNLYPVPDLNVPFLGVHFTPNYNNSEVYIGPTATPAFGRYNYKSFQGIEPLMAFSNIIKMTKQYIFNKEGFRRYGNEQALLSLPPFFLKSAKQLLPSLSANDIEPSNKVGIRSQLFNNSEQKLVNDFLCLSGPSSTHVLNAISPAFTASFELADLIISKIEFT